MSDNSVKGKYFAYNGEEGEPIPTDEVSQSEAVKMIVEFIMSVGNGPMIDGEEKFGYTYVDTTGATYVDSHPDADGHIYIANKIIEALPSANSSDGAGNNDNTDSGLNGGDNNANENQPDNNVGDNNENETPPVDGNENNVEDNNVNNDVDIPDTDVMLIVAPVVVVFVSLAMIIIFARRKRIEE